MYKKLVYFIVLVVGLVIVATLILNGGKEEKTLEQVVNDEAVVAGEKVALDLATDKSFSFDSASSITKWEGKKTFIDGYVDRGNLTLESGEIKIENGSITGELVYDMNTIVVESTGLGKGEESLQNHLKSEAFFDVANSPKTNFRIKEIKREEGEDIYTVMGDLEIKGIVNEISFPAEIYMTNIDGEDVLKLVANVVLDRTKWDIRFGSASFFDNLANNTIDDNFTVSLNLSAKAV